MKENGFRMILRAPIARESPLGPFESALAAAMKEVSSANTYPEAGHGQLRQELATHFDSPLEHVAAGAGARSLIHHCLLPSLMKEPTSSLPALRSPHMSARP